MTSIVESLRQPEYTGENRCTPCTIANSVIAVVLSGGLTGGLVAFSVASLPVAAAAGLALLGVSAASIWLRGYLVPKTPELTKRYFPDWLLAKFDKEPESFGTVDRRSREGAGGEAGGGHADGQGHEGEADHAHAHQSEDDGEFEELDPEAALLEAGAVEECVEVEDLCLTDEFRAAWGEHIERVSERDVETEDIVAALHIDDLGEDASLTEFGDAVVLNDGNEEVGKWESEAALVADVAAADALAERYDRWSGLDAYDRSRLLRGLRIFLQECPLCGGPMDLGQDTVESCCRSYDVVAVTCGQCEARLFEERWQGGQGVEA